MPENPLYLLDNTKIHNDLFSDILRLTNASPFISGGFSAGGSWALPSRLLRKSSFSLIRMLEER
jgi:hypothetical protein